MDTKKGTTVFKLLASKDEALLVGSEAQCGRHGHTPVDAVSDSAGLWKSKHTPQKRRGGSKNEIDACHEGRGQGEVDKISITGLAEYPLYLGSWHACDEKGVVGICLVWKAYHMMVLAGKAFSFSKTFQNCSLQNGESTPIGQCFCVLLTIHFRGITPTPF